MDANTIISIIGSVGFPIVACGAMAYYVKYITDRSREQIKEIMEQHRKEMTDVTEAVKNNTLALQKLASYIEKGENSE